MISRATAGGQPSPSAGWELQYSSSAGHSLIRLDLLPVAVAQLSFASEPMCALDRKSQVGMPVMAWWMFMAVISLGALF